MAGLNRMIEQQAEFIAFLHDFQIMTIVTLCMLPLLLLLRDRRAET
jgi:hypothetical protein